GLTEGKMLALFRRDHLIDPQKIVEKSPGVGLPNRWREFALATGVILLFALYLVYQLTRN
ncbi:MAG: hypothetical protein ABID04_04005, partial [Patescibacteria group bacterium]